MGRMYHYGEAGNRLTQLKVLIATPCYDTVTAAYAHSLMAATTRLIKEGIEFNCYLYSGNCHVDDGRNRLVRDFLETDCTDLLFIDADLWFNPASIVQILRHDVDVVAGIYPYKQDDVDYPVELINDTYKIETNGLMEVKAVPTGFLRIRRSVLEKLASVSKTFPAKNDYAGRPQQPIIFERIHQDGVRYGGDYAFCIKWRNIGGKIYVDPKMTFEHCGEKAWRGNYFGWLKQTSGNAMQNELADIRNGTENTETFISLVEQYGNGMFTAMPELIAASAYLARETAGIILECGSGLTTLTMAAANPKAKIISLENELTWATNTKTLLDKHGLNNVELIYAPLKDYGDYLWYDWQPNGHKINMVLCDGPTRKTKGGRSGLYHIAKNNIVPGAVMLFDDYDGGTKKEVELWNDKITTRGVGRLFAITTKGI